MHTINTMKNTPRLLLFVYLCLTTAIGWIEALLPNSLRPLSRVVQTLTYQQISSIVQAFKVDENPNREASKSFLNGVKWWSSSISNSKSEVSNNNIDMQSQTSLPSNLFSSGKMLTIEDIDKITSSIPSKRIPSSSAAHHPIGFYDIGDPKAEAQKMYKSTKGPGLGRSLSSTWFNM